MRIWTQEIKRNRNLDDKTDIARHVRWAAVWRRRRQIKRF